MKGGPGPIADAGYVSVLLGVPVRIIDASVQVVFILDGMFRITPLPNPRSAWRTRERLGRTSSPRATYQRRYSSDREPPFSFVGPDRLASSLGGARRSTARPPSFHSFTLRLLILRVREASCGARGVRPGACHALRCFRGAKGDTRLRAAPKELITQARWGRNVVDAAGNAPLESRL